MKLRSWLSTCTTTTTTMDSTFSSSKPGPNLSPKLFVSNSSSSSDTPISSTSSSSNSCDTFSTSTSSSLQSNLSLQTVPSIPSLQQLLPDSLNLSVSHTCIASFIPRLPFPITCLEVHDNLIYTASTHEINVYDRNASSYPHLNVFNAHNLPSGSIKAVAFCNGKVFTAHQDCKIRVWKVASNKRHKLLTTLPTVKDRLLRFALPNNYVIVRRHKKKLWIEHADAVTDLTVKDGLIYSVSWDKSLKIWRASDLRCLESVKAHDDAVNAVVVSTDGTVYTGSADRRIRVWAKQLGEKRHNLVATLEKHKSAVNALALNDDGSVLFSGACDRSILVWEREDSANYMAVSGALRGHGKAVLGLFFVSDALFSGSADRTVRMWRRGYDGKYCCLAVLEGHLKPVRSLTAVMENDQSNVVVTVFSGSLDGEARVWQIIVSNTKIDSVI